MNEWTHTKGVVVAATAVIVVAISLLLFFTDSHRAVQAFESMGLICVAMALLILCLYVFMDRMRKRSPLIAIIVFTFAAGKTYGMYGGWFVPHRLNDFGFFSLFRLLAPKRQKYEMECINQPP